MNIHTRAVFRKVNEMMKDKQTEKNTGTTALKGANKAYQKPELKRYGAIRELTTGGSAHANEDNANPGNPDENKRRP